MGNIGFAVAVHGGAGGTSADRDGCERAAALGREALENGASALDAAVRCVVALEDDGRYNAGYGAALCLDGTSEMDAAVMDSRGTLGAVACLRHARNPVLAAREVARTPHWLLAGEGADRFAATLALPGRRQPSPEALKKHARVVARLGKASDNPFHRFWNYATPWETAIAEYGCGTVGAVVLDADGGFAVATSTGGCAPSLLGRVGDTPIIGCGFFAGEHGAVAVTGIGEAIVPRMVARTIYDEALRCGSLERAVSRVFAGFPDGMDLGVIAVTRTEMVLKSNGDMPCASQGT